VTLPPAADAVVDSPFAALSRRRNDN
jgi:hypothetical protein